MIEFLSNLQSLSLSRAFNLMTLLVLLIPIIIHLINPNKANLIWVASIKLIKVSDEKNIFKIKWLERILLLLRVILFTLICFILAKPVLLTTVIKTNETHHYFSVDWLVNINKHDKNRLDESIKATDKLYLLDDSKTKPIKSIEQLIVSAKELDKTRITEYNNQEAYVNELNKRLITAETTHVYITNRNINFNYATSFEVDADSNQLHIKKLDVSHQQQPIFVEVIYDKDSNYESDFLVVALEILKKQSSEAISIKTRMVGRGFSNIYKKEEVINADLVFIIGTDINKNLSNNQVLVSGDKDSLVFTSSYDDKMTWEKSSPKNLIAILSDIMTRLEKVSRTEIISDDVIKQLLSRAGVNKEEQFTDLVPISTDSYFIFIFCLLLLLERWMVLRRDKSNG